MQVEQVSTIGDPQGFPAYRNLNPVARLNLVEGFGCSEEEQNRIEDGAALVLIVFPQEELQLPLLVIAAKDREIVERVSTARYNLVWRTTKREKKECELYVGGQALHRQEIGKAIRLFAGLETSQYGEEYESRRVFRALEDFDQLIEVGMTIGPEDSRDILETRLMGPTRTNALRYLRFEVRL